MLESVIALRGVKEVHCKIPRLRSPNPSTFMKTAAFLLSSLVLVAGPSWAAESQTAQTKPDLAKGQAKAAQICFTCHAADGSRGQPVYPIIQGQHMDYLVKQLHEFKEGKRKDDVMGPQAKLLTDAEIRDVAAFYATKQVKPGFATNKDTITLGEKIYRGGIADKMVPACAGCHSPNGAGIPAQYPRLGGQHAAYTEKQLNLFRAGNRANSPQMAAIAAKLSDKEIKAVSDYIAGLR